MIFGGDKKAFDEAISEHLPDDNTRKEIEKEISTLKRLLVKYNRDKELILDKVLNQNLNSSIIEGLNQRADIEQWWDELQDENCTKYSRKEESYGLRMGGTGLEPVASCV